MSERESSLKLWLERGESREESPAPKLPRSGRRNILITSALPYVNNVPHLGNIIGCVLSADVFARYARSRGYQALFICGTDEYGTATETKALEEKTSPKAVCDKYNALHTHIYRWFHIDFDYFGRTTTEVQTRVAQAIFKAVQRADHLLEKEVEQLHCGACQRFLADRYVFGLCPHCGYEDARGDQCDACSKLLNATELKEPRCHLCRQEPSRRTSKHLFLDLAKLQPRLQAHLDAAWANEANNWSSNAISITKAWLKDGLKERCITRDLKWGTPVPAEGFQDKVFYVWFDAPIGYISMTAAYTEEWERWWRNPEEVEYYNFLGKDNVPFHSVIFPATLIGTEETWTKVTSISATEYLNYEEAKFSKRKGIGVFGNDAMDTGIPADVWRFYLLYVRPESQDTAFAWDDFALKVNSELLNNLGNFVNRALTFVKTQFDYVIPEMEMGPEEEKLLGQVNEEVKEYINLMEAAKLRDGIRCILNISRLGNGYIQAEQPWLLCKGDAESRRRGGCVVGVAANLAGLLAALIQPYMPETAATMRAQLNADDDVLLPSHAIRLLPPGHRIGEPSPLFARIEAAKAAELKRRFAGDQAGRKEAAEEKNNSNNNASKQPKTKAAKTPKKEAKDPAKATPAQPAKHAMEESLRPGADAPAWLAQLWSKGEAATEQLNALHKDFLALCTRLEADELPQLKKETGQAAKKVADLKAQLTALEAAHGVPQISVPKPGKTPKAPQPSQEQTPAKPSNEEEMTKKKEKKEKAKGKGEGGAPKTGNKGGGGGGDKAAEASLPVDVSRLDLRVGFIREAKKHPDAESLYVEVVDCGEEATRTVVSGLVKHVPLEEMQQRPVVLMCNLKPAKMRGIESAAMVMCASTPEKVEILRPPEGSKPGDRLVCSAFPGQPDAQLNPKKKVWEAVAPDLKVDAEGRLVYKGELLHVGGEHIRAPSLTDVQVK